ncbi:hypothetical protein NKH81_20415 [Mesorhizobium sp. M0959]|uniref:hypothetical protein n=1 Tax=Mesorhizobium sp. M0959 TaxID=2957034 RepID=UPI00333BF22F
MEEVLARRANSIEKIRRNRLARAARRHAVNETPATRKVVEAPPLQPTMAGLVDDTTDAEIKYRHYHDAPAAKPLGKGKRFHTDRYKAPWPLLSWSNAKCAYIGYLTGRGYTSGEIERILRDGTSKDTIRGQWRRWGLPLPEVKGQRCSIMPVALGFGPRTKLTKRAKQVGIAPDEFLRRIILSVLDDDLYQAVVDDRFDGTKEGR